MDLVEGDFMVSVIISDEVGNIVIVSDVGSIDIIVLLLILMLLEEGNDIMFILFGSINFV